MRGRSDVGDDARNCRQAVRRPIVPARCSPTNARRPQSRVPSYTEITSPACAENDCFLDTMEIITAAPDYTHSDVQHFLQ